MSENRLKPDAPIPRPPSVDLMPDEPLEIVFAEDLEVSQPAAAEDGLPSPIPEPAAPEPAEPKRGDSPD
jgi:hypothetical protein